MNPFGRHAREFVAAHQAHQWEHAEHGIRFPRQRTLLVGEYAWRVKGGPLRRQRNLITTEGLAFMVANVMSTTSPPDFYCALWNGNTTPLLSWTGASFTADATELTSGTEGYLESARPLWNNFGGVGIGNDVYGEVSNKLAGGPTPTTFSLRTATQLTVRGYAMLTTSPKGDVTGTLLSALKFPAAELYDNLDILDVYYAIRLQQTA